MTMHNFLPHTDADREAHRAFVATLGDKPIWNDFLPVAAA